MQFDSSFFGSQELTADDIQYAGSRYADVRNACFQTAYYLNWGAAGEAPLPTYSVSLGRVLKGVLPGSPQWKFKQAVGRAVDAASDLRWGADRLGFRRLLHPNGVVLFGRWIIDRPTEFTGHFKQGTEALIIARYSTCCTEPRRGYTRSLSMVGKLYPTIDPDHAKPLQTANFITQEDIGGQRTLFINDAELRNAPNVTPLRRGLGLPVLLVTGLVFRLIDRMPTVRQLYPIAELGHDPNTPTKSPEYMQLTVAEDQPRIYGDAIDFRDEVLAQIYDRGDPLPKRKLVFDIKFSKNSKQYGLLTTRRKFAPWETIGRIEFTEAVASYNGDFVLHFHHPPWRLDTNKPKTVVRKPKDSA